MLTDVNISKNIQWAAVTALLLINRTVMSLLTHYVVSAADSICYVGVLMARFYWAFHLRIRHLLTVSEQSWKAFQPKIDLLLTNDYWLNTVIQ